MEKTIGFYIFIIVISSLLTAMLGIYTMKKAGKGPGVSSYFYMTIGTVIYALAYAFVLSSEKLATIKFWIMVEYLGLPFISVFCLMMCLRYSGLEKILDHHRKYLLFIIPLISILLHYTNDFHHLFYKSIKVIQEGSSSVAILEKGSWYYIYAGYSFSCIGLGIFALFSRWRSSHHYGRLQILFMTIGLLIPVTASLVYIAQIIPTRIDFAPVSLSVSAIFQGVAILSFGMFNLVPIIKEKLFENMQDGVLVLNQDGCLVDFNVAATQLIPLVCKNVLGKKLEDILHQHPGIISQMKRGLQDGEYEFIKGNGRVYYQIRSSQLLANNGQRLGTMVLITDVTEKTLIFRKMERMATIDDLTQIYNRKYFFDLTNQKFKEVNKSEGEIAIIMFDIDHFKKINDTFGHDMGDKVLTQVAAICKDKIGEDSIFGRYGGEEFIICLPFTNLETAIKIAKLLKSSLEVAPILNNLSVTASFGVAVGSSKKPDELAIENLIKKADQLLYQAKRKGRNNVQF